MIDRWPFSRYDNSNSDHCLARSEFISVKMQFLFILIVTREGHFVTVSRHSRDFSPICLFFVSAFIRWKSVWNDGNLTTDDSRNRQMSSETDENESLEHCSISWDDCGMWFSGLLWDYGRVPQDDFMNHCGDKVTVAMDLWNWDSHNITVVGVYFGKTDLWRGV